MQQQQRWVKNSSLGLIPRSSKETMQWRITFHERTHVRMRKNGTGNSGNPALPLLEHTALCRRKISLCPANKKTRKVNKKRERRFWSECQWQMRVSAAAGGLLLCNGALFGVSQNSHLPIPSQIL